MKEIVNELNFISEQVPGAFLVGGFVRDILDGKISRDIDIVVDGDVSKISRAFANAVSGSWFPLDEERSVYRVVLKKESEWFFDFAPLRHGNIKSDLLERDFTIDAIALPIKEWAQPLNFIDPTGGIKDLKERIVRMVSGNVFKADPLRLLRAFRIASRIDGRICGETLSQIRKDAPLISGVSGERIRDEIYGILESGNSSRWCGGIFNAGLFHFLFPEFAAFDHNTISDVILHLRYTARQGGDALKTVVVGELQEIVNQMALAASRRGLYRWFSLKHEFPGEWHRLLTAAEPETGDSLGEAGGDDAHRLCG